LASYQGLSSKNRDDPAGVLIRSLPWSRESRKQDFGEQSSRMPVALLDPHDLSEPELLENLAKLRRETQCGVRLDRD
jgi:hypothetical protein